MKPFRHSLTFNEKYFLKNPKNIFAVTKQSTIFALAKLEGAIAQLVEQRTENPCVPSSILGGTTEIRALKSED